jgi:CO dehydrogenase nickel-insertion accessory protein CooC1
MKTYQVTSFKGGVGNTTVACAMSLRLARSGQKTLLIDNTNTKLSISWLALQDNGTTGVAMQVGENLWLMQTGGLDRLSIPDAMWDAVVIDEPTGHVSTLDSDMDVQKVTVLRNDFMCMKQAVQNIPNAKDWKVFLILEEGRALEAMDIQTVIGTDVITVKIDPKVSRTIDAGLTPNRVELFEWADEVLAITR